MQTDDVDVLTDNPDGPPSPAAPKEQPPRPERRGVLREYIESFDQQTLQSTGVSLRAPGLGTHIRSTSV